jgi:predicted tellurium resistance membrane protein TerC
MFGQTFDPHDLAVIGLLIVLEGVLSIDNALVLGLLAKRLPKKQQGRALTYGLVGAFVFRIIAIATASFLLRWRIVKLLGGGYLVYVAVKHFFFTEHDPEDDEHAGPATAGFPVVAQGSDEDMSAERREREIKRREPPVVDAVDAALTPAAPAAGERQCEHCDAIVPAGTRQCTKCGARIRIVAGFWSTVAVIELTDIAFAIDSILAAIALVGSPPEGTPKDAAHPKLWVVVAGGMLGVILMRFAAVVFIKLLERFPRFETSAYLLVVVIGLKLVLDWAFNSAEHPHRIDFHDFRSPAFWAFWVTMLVCFAVGFVPKKRKAGGVEKVPQPPAETA